MTKPDSHYTDIATERCAGQNSIKNLVPINHDGKIIDPLVRRKVNAYVEQLRRMTELVQEQEIEIKELRAQLKALDEQEPATIKVSGNVWRGQDPTSFPDGTKLYIQAKPAVPEESNK